MPFIRYFLYVFVAGLLSAVAGGGFAAAVALISPEFIHMLLAAPNGASLTRYAAALGMIYGLVIGASVMGFSLALATAIQIAKIFTKKEQ